MARREHVLFVLDRDGRHRLSCDELQWILERSHPAASQPSKDSGYRGVSFVATSKSILRRCIREKGIALTPRAAALLEGLPESFAECRRGISASGIGDFRQWLHDRAEVSVVDAGGLLAAH